MSTAKYTKLAQNDTVENNNCVVEIENNQNTNVNSITPKVNFSRLCSNATDQWTQKDLNSQLLTAIYQDELDTVKTLLQKGANPNTTCRKYHFTAVHLAILTGSEDILLELFANNANCHEIDKCGLSPLHYASWYDRPGCMHILLKRMDKKLRQEFVNKRVEKQERCILELVKDSLDHTCREFEDELPVDVQTGSTALHIACQKLSLKCVEILLDEKPSINIEDSRCLTAFEVIGELLTEYRESIEQSFIKIIKKLNHSGGKKGSSQLLSNNYFTPIHAAVMLRSTQGIYLTIKEGLNPKLLDTYGQTPIHLAIIKQLQEPLKALLDCVQDASCIKNLAGFTPFQTAVEQQWVHGIGLLLSANVDVTEVAVDGRTVLHVAAACGNVDLLEELLELDEIVKILNKQNNIGETPIYCAISSGNPQCVDALLDKGVDIGIKLNGNINVLHRAAEHGDENIIYSLIKATEEEKLNLLDELDELPFSGMTPLHMAADNNKADCVKALLNANCEYKKKTTPTPHSGSMGIHLAATKGNHEVVRAFLEYDDTLLWETDDADRDPLHCAALQGQRKCIEVILNAGADLSSIYDDETALDVIYRTVSRPTEFLDNIFDNAICVDDVNSLITDKNCMINIGYNILIPKNDSNNQMSILSNILLNGKDLEQRKLLLHPLIESFLHLKWNKMSNIFWMLLTLYAIFVGFLTVFVISMFYYKCASRPDIFYHVEIYRFCLGVSLCAITVPELLLAIQKLKHYYITTDRVIKWMSIILVTILILYSTNHSDEWLRHVATIALLTSWIEMMFMFSKMPTLGYYVQMFFKVSQNVIKVMAVFSFLVIGFALAFMIEFQSIEPFSDPLTGFIKTIVMMTSELDYSGLFTGENKENAQIINLSIYVIFLLLGAIVLMNLLVGLAVSDIHDLEIIGKIDRHVQQIDFLNMLESDTLVRFLPQKLKTKLMRVKRVPSTLRLYPSNPRCKVIKQLSQQLKERIIDIADINVKRKSEVTLNQLYEQVNYLTSIVENLNNQLSSKNK